MFFFTRYPSSNLLKAYFPDVQVKSFIGVQPLQNSPVAVGLPGVRQVRGHHMCTFAPLHVVDGLVQFPVWAETA